MEKNADAVASITELVKKSILFQSLSETDLSILVQAMTIENFNIGDIAIQEK